MDFIIIGAQKCATTTLFEHLRSHPDIAMPLEKEVPFFAGEGYSAENWPAFARKQFGAAQQDKLWGKATPQYMSDPYAALRIKALMPDTKLVAILRDPIQRTWSHFRMGQRRDTEHREFSEAIASLLSRGEEVAGQPVLPPNHANGYESEAEFYVSWSEYGRILQQFTEHFDPRQLLILYTEDLEADPASTLDRLLDFIGLPTGFRPNTLGEVIHRGGASNRIPHSVRGWLRDRKLLYRMWQRLPDAQRGRLRFRYEQWNVRKAGDTLHLPENLYEQLRKHYSEDIISLLRLPIDSPPWVDRYLGSR